MASSFSTRPIVRSIIPAADAPEQQLDRSGAAATRAGGIGSPLMAQRTLSSETFGELRHPAGTDYGPVGRSSVFGDLPPKRWQQCSHSGGIGRARKADQRGRVLFLSGQRGYSHRDNRESA